jgi:hypothetical protein
VFSKAVVLIIKRAVPGKIPKESKEVSMILGSFPMKKNPKWFNNQRYAGEQQEVIRRRGDSVEQRSCHEYPTISFALCKRSSCGYLIVV